jgi:hypothetical protein
MIQTTTTTTTTTTTMLTQQLRVAISAMTTVTITVLPTSPILPCKMKLLDQKVEGEAMRFMAGLLRHHISWEVNPDNALTLSIQHLSLPILRLSQAWQQQSHHPPLRHPHQHVSLTASWLPHLFHNSHIPAFVAHLNSIGQRNLILNISV